MDGAQKEHTECCSQCPGSVCVVQESEEFGVSPVPAVGDASAEPAPVSAADASIEPAAVEDPLEGVGESAPSMEAGQSLVPVATGDASAEQAAVGESVLPALGDASTEFAPAAAADVSIEPIAVKDPLEGVSESTASTEAGQKIVSAATEGAASAEPAEVVPKTCGGTALGAACQFPFEYHGVQFTACTSTDNGQPWCYTAVAGQWGNCNCLPS